MSFMYYNHSDVQSISCISVINKLLVITLHDMHPVVFLSTIFVYKIKKRNMTLAVDSVLHTHARCCTANLFHIRTANLL